MGRYHAQVIASDSGQLYVRDLDSVNGTFLNNEMVIGQKPLQKTDLLRLGKSFELSTGVVARVAEEQRLAPVRTYRRCGCGWVGPAGVSCPHCHNKLPMEVT